MPSSSAFNDKWKVNEKQFVYINSYQTELANQVDAKDHSNVFMTKESLKEHKLSDLLRKVGIVISIKYHLLFQNKSLNIALEKEKSNVSMMKRRLQVC
jgi:hypothetical protein